MCTYSLCSCPLRIVIPSTFSWLADLVLFYSVCQFTSTYMGSLDVSYMCICMIRVISIYCLFLPDQWPISHSRWNDICTFTLANIFSINKINNIALLLGMYASLWVCWGFSSSSTFLFMVLSPSCWYFQVPVNVPTGKSCAKVCNLIASFTLKGPTISSSWSLKYFHSGSLDLP